MELTFLPQQTHQMSPRMMQYMSVLQMSATELYEYVQQAQENNPVLEFQDGSPTVTDKVRYLESAPVRTEAFTYDDADDDFDELNKYGAAPLIKETLYAHVAAQIKTSAGAENVKALALKLAASMDKNGYLQQEEIDGLERSSGNLFEKALALLQQCDPAGVGARSLKECIRLQLLRSQEDTALALTIAEEYLADIGRNCYQRIAKATQSSLNDVYEACRLIKSTNCNPGIAFMEDEIPDYIRPDVLINSELEIELNDNWIPRLQLSSYYGELMSTVDADTKDWLDDRFSKARWVLESIEQRRRSIISCTEVIIEKQHDFFTGLSDSVCSMTQRDVSEMLGIHESTVSRALRGKYLQCSRGIYPFSYFFSSNISQADGSAVSSSAVKNLITQLISEEDRKKPLSDQKIAELLMERQINVSRRAIAKYRTELDIPSTAGRRAQYYGEKLPET